MLRALSAAVAVGLVTVACSGVPAPQDVDTCDGLVVVGVDWVKRTATALEGQPLEVVTGDAEPPEELVELQAVGAALDARAAELGCSMSDLNLAIALETSDLESDDPVVSLFLDVVRFEAAEG